MATLGFARFSLLRFAAVESPSASSSIRARRRGPFGPRQVAPAGTPVHEARASGHQSLSATVPGPYKAWHSILLLTIQELDRPDDENAGVPTQLEAFAGGTLAHVVADFAEDGIVTFAKYSRFPHLFCSALTA
jgi:hypothetical protein